MVIKRCPGGAGGGRSTSKSTCEVPAWTLTAFGDRSASSMSKYAWTLTPDMIPFGSKSVTLSMLIDLLTSRCRSTQVKLYTGLIASIDLWPQEMFTFSEMLALVQSESSFGAFVSHRRPAGLPATSDLVVMWRISSTCHTGIEHCFGRGTPQKWGETPFFTFCNGRNVQSLCPPSQGCLMNVWNERFFVFC